MRNGFLGRGLNSSMTFCRRRNLQLSLQLFNIVFVIPTNLATLATTYATSSEIGSMLTSKNTFFAKSCCCLGHVNGQQRKSLLSAWKVACNLWFSCGKTAEILPWVGGLPSDNSQLETLITCCDSQHDNSLHHREIARPRKTFIQESPLETFEKSRSKKKINKTVLKELCFYGATFQCEWFTDDSFLSLKRLTWISYFKTSKNR